LSYKSFRNEIIQKDGAFYTEQVEKFLEKAVELAKNEKYEDALAISHDAIFLARYSNAGYANLYLYGMLCHLYIDSDKPEIANKFFLAGMDMIEYYKGQDQSEDEFMNDINAFLDLKIVIDREMNK